jgi:branched-chain amino acid transport system permease protein
MLAYLCAIGIVALIYCLLALGLNLQFGLTRLVNFGVVAFCRGRLHLGPAGPAGRAAAAELCRRRPAGGPAGAAHRAAVAAPARRLPGHRDAGLFGGGAHRHPARRLADPGRARPARPAQAVCRLGAQLSDLAIFAHLLVLVAVVAWGTVRLAGSPFGRLLKAIGDDEAALAALGKDPAWFKVQVFMLGAVLAGLAGAFYAHFITFITPEQFIPLITFYVWMGLVMGGSGTVRGAVFGSLLLMVFLEGSRFAKDWMPGVSEVGMASLRMAAVGLALILVTLYNPTVCSGARGNGQ